ncbi:GAF domain-containing protein, partial [Treponema sp. R8-4-B8]
MINNEKAGQDLSGRRAAIVTALNKSIEIFSAHEEETFEEVMINGIRPFADAIGLDRVVFYKLVNIGEGKRLKQVYRWDKSEGCLMSLVDEMKFLPNNPLLDKWLSISSQGGYIRFRESDYTEDVAAFMRAFGVKSILITPVFTHGKYWGVVNFQDHTNDRYFDEDCADLLHSAACIFSNAVIREEMKQREKMEAALNRAAIMFLSQNEETFEAAMTAGVKEIADVFNLDRFSLLRSFTMSGGLQKGGQIYRWDRESGGTTAPIKGLESFSPEKYVPNWRKIFTSGGAINGPVRLMSEAAVLQSFGLVSICVTPVFINNDFWGIAFFEDLHTERYFDKDSVEIMRLAAFLCANTVIRADMEKDILDHGEQLKIKLEQQELISELSRGFISSGDSQTLVQEAIAKLGRYHKVSLVFIFAIDYQRKDIYLAYHWCADNTIPRNSISNLYDYLIEIFPVTLPDCATLPIIVCDDTSANPDAIYQELNGINVKAIIGVPLY